MKNLLQQHKRGISEIVSYTLLVVIAVGVSFLVYNYLQIYIPKDKPTCSQDVSLLLQQAVCTINVGNPNPSSNSVLNLTFQNNGNFKIDAIYVRIGITNKNFKVWLNNPATNSNPESSFYILDTQSVKGLLPGANTGIISYNMTDFTHYLKTLNPNLPTNQIPGSYMLEIEPAINDKNTNKLAACDNAIIDKPITCTCSSINNGDCP